ncbi:MAG: hypothetical protein FWG70_10340 [Oscillospiraceae bacterium]|nr:hypothetical protein [Oscillospiraceae bacterium]
MRIWRKALLFAVSGFKLFSSARHINPKAEQTKPTPILFKARKIVRICTHNRRTTDRTKSQNAVHILLFLPSVFFDILRITQEL